jgi:hypothetical protein
MLRMFDPFGVDGALSDANRGRCPRLLECNASGVEDVGVEVKPNQARPR